MSGAGIEGLAHGAVRAALNEVRRPVVSDGTGIVETGSVLVACGWKENAVATSTGNQHSIYSIPSRPRPTAPVP